MTSNNKNKSLSIVLFIVYIYLCGLNPMPGKILFGTDTIVHRRLFINLFLASSYRVAEGLKWPFFLRFSGIVFEFVSNYDSMVSFGVKIITIIFQSSFELLKDEEGVFPGFERGRPLVSSSNERAKLRIIFFLKKGHRVPYSAAYCSRYVYCSANDCS